MKDIQKAIQAQHKYRQALEIDPFTANIYEYLAPYGYTNLDEFTSDKIKYLLKNSNIPITITNPDECLQSDLIEILIAKHQLFISINNGKIFAWHQNDDIDTELFKSYGIPIYETHGEGGTIISGPNDLDVALVLDRNDWDVIKSNYFLEALAQMVKKYLPNHTIEIDNNDILCDGKKIIGATTGEVGSKLLYMAHISFYDFSALAEILCDKDSSKTPGCVPAELSRATLLEEIESYFK